MHTAAYRKGGGDKRGNTQPRPRANTLSASIHLNLNECENKSFNKNGTKSEKKNYLDKFESHTTN